MRNLLIGQLATVCVVLGTVGCSSDGLADAGYGADDGETSDPLDTDGNAGDTSGGVEGGYDTDNESTGGGETGDGPEDTSGDDGFADPCDLVSCSDVGTCISQGEETWCECPEGYIGDGPDCLPCPKLGDVTDLSLDTYLVTATVRINNNELPSQVYEEAQFWLENRATGDRVDFGKSYHPVLSARVLPGAYDLVYSYVTGDELPRHSHYVIQPVIVRADRDLDINLPLIPISGSITVNGEAPPTVQYDDGDIYFVSAETGDEIYAGTSRDGLYELSAFPGEYELRYRVEDAGDIMPANKDAYVGDAVLDPQNEVHVANVDLRTTILAGDIQINGSAPPAVQYDDGNVFLRTDDGDEVELGSTRDQAYEVVVLQGVYDFEYELEDGGTDVPANERAFISQVDVLDVTMQNFQADVPRVTYSGNFTLNGGAIPNSQYDDGTLRLRDVDNGGEVYLGNTHDGSFSVGLVPGEYGIFYAVDTAGAQMPVNVDAQLKGVSIVTDTDEPIDIPSVAISGAFTVANAAPPQSEYEDGRLYLRKDDGKDAVLLGYTHDGGYGLNVIPGDYEVFFAHEFGTGAVPDNSNGQLMPLSVEAPMSFDVDVPVVPLAGSFTLDGSQTPNNYADSGQLYLRRRSDGDSISLGATHTGSYDVAVTPGTYEVFYARSENVAMMPRNENARVTCFVVE